MAQIEITGWDSDGESAEASGSTREGETADQAIDRLAREWDIIEIGDTKVIG